MIVFKKFPTVRQHCTYPFHDAEGLFPAGFFGLLQVPAFLQSRSNSCNHYTVALKPRASDQLPTTPTWTIPLAYRRELFHTILERARHRVLADELPHDWIGLNNLEHVEEETTEVEDLIQVKTEIC